MWRRVVVDRSFMAQGKPRLALPQRILKGRGRFASYLRKGSMTSMVPSAR